MRIPAISKTDTLYFKAIGILLIVFHNYFHHVEPRIGENDWYFSIDVIKKFWLGITSAPLESINLLFSGFGHYGVQIFILISGVGLAISLAHKQLHYGNFVWQRLKKIYVMLIVASIVRIFALIICYKIMPDSKSWLAILSYFTLTHTIIPMQGASYNGPLWFIGLIVQLYLLFPLLLKIIKTYNFKGLVAICVFSYICSYIELYLFHLPEGVHWTSNSIAHLPEFALGIYVALNIEKKIPSWVFITAAVVFIASNFSKALFPVSFLSISLILYFVISKLIVLIRKSTWTSKILVNLGTLSMALFITHGTFRQRFQIQFHDNWFDKIIGAILFFITVYAVAIIANIFYKWIYNLLTVRIGLLLSNRANSLSKNRI
ncbi:MAG: acyltransferase family protein [Bacteroidetes bacterium]|nr:acyltransferase family protein [Bacteroidota bacterium]